MEALLFFIYVVNKCINPVSYTHLDVYKRQKKELFIKTNQIANTLRMKVIINESNI